MPSKRVRERKQELRKTGDRQKRRTYLMIAAIAGVIAIAVIGGFLLFRGGASNSGSGSSDKPGESFPDLGNRHLKPGEFFNGYNSTPPTSGPHTEGITTWGVHATDLQKEQAVHNLEDGGVIIYYRADRSDLADPLKPIVRRYPDKVILAPYSALPTPITVVAWGRLQRFETVDEAGIVKFIEAYRGIDHHKK